MTYRKIFMISMLRSSIAFTLVTAALPALAENRTHCTAEEHIVFSCSIEKKTVSICASKGFTSSRGYLQYRFGAIGKPELIFPSLSDVPEKYTNRQWVMLSGGAEAHLRFKKGNFGYVVYSGLGSWGEYHGIAVERAGKVVANHECKAPPFPISEIGNTGFDQLGLPLAEDDEILRR